jgi:hypothetical protein
MSPDWAAKPVTVPYATFGDPQTLNLYSYVENGPLNRVDADGHAANKSGIENNWLGFDEGPCAGTWSITCIEQTHADNIGSLNLSDETADEQAYDAMVQASQQGVSQSQSNASNSTSTAQQQNTNQEKRDSLAANAEAQKGSTSWAYDAKPCGNKCSKFVGDMLSLIGIGIKQGYKSDPDAPPVAGDWLNPKASIANWQVLKPGQAPMPGDIAAEAINDPHAGATAHMGIVISNGHGGVTAVAAGHNSVYRTNEFFDPNHVVTFRRYTGN